jgi:hypothetical protein
MSNNSNFPSPEELLSDKSSATEQFAVRAKVETLATLRYYAQQSNKSFAALINSILDYYVKQYPLPNDVRDAIIPNTTNENITGFSFDGAITQANTGINALVGLLNKLDQAYPGFFEKFTHSSYNRGRIRKSIAKDRRELYPGKPYMLSLARELDSGYWLDGNISSAAKDKIARSAAKVLGLNYGKDFELFCRTSARRQPANLSGLVVGDIYTNKEIQNMFQCGAQGGMRRSKQTNSLVLIMKHDGDNPYDDTWNDGILDYTGMGMYGDQSLDYAQNKTLAESQTNGVKPHLFESFDADSYIYRGVAVLAGRPHYEREDDADGQSRRVAKFPLRISMDA